MSDSSESKQGSKIGSYQRKVRAGSSKFEKQFLQLYGVSRKQLDIILLQLCLQYDRQWAIISTALYNEHKIRMNESRIKDRFNIYLDPKLIKDPFTFEEEMMIIKKFCLETKRFKYIRQAFPNRDRYIIKSVLESYMRKGIKRMQGYIWDQISGLPENCMIKQGEVNKIDLVHTLISDRKIKREQNKSTYKLLYFFMIAKFQNFYMIPKDLCLLLYRRLSEIRKEMERQRQERFNRVDPTLYNQMMEKQFKQKKYMGLNFLKNSAAVVKESQKERNKENKSEEIKQKFRKRRNPLKKQNIRFSPNEDSQAQVTDSSSQVKFEEIEEDLSLLQLPDNFQFDLLTEDLEFNSYSEIDLPLEDLQIRSYSQMDLPLQDLQFRSQTESKTEF